MTEHILVRHRVEDFPKWKTLYEKHANGVHSDNGFDHSNIFTVPGDENDVVVHFMLSDIEKAQAFFESDDLKEAMKEAGVTEKPVVYHLSFSQK